jgi:hypothetical protein
MWKTRNEIVHGASVDDQANILLGHLHQRVHDYYHKFQLDQTFLLPRHHYLFQRRTLDQCLAHSYDHIKCWLDSVEEAEQVLAHHVQQQHAISDLFFPLTRPRADSSQDSTYLPSKTSITTGILTLATERTTLSSPEEDSSSLSSTFTSASHYTLSFSAETADFNVTCSTSSSDFLSSPQ